MAARGARTVVVVTGGDPLGDQALPTLPADAHVVAADSGVDHALALGLAVHTAVGDFDSVSEAGLRPWSPRAGSSNAIRRRRTPPTSSWPSTRPVARPRAHRRARRPRRPPRPPAGQRPPARRARAGRRGGRRPDGPVPGDRRARRRDLVGQPGDLVTLLPAHGPALGVVTDGLLYPLRDEDLPAGTTRGVSNELALAEATVRLRGGTLLAIQPGVAGTDLLSPPITS